MKTKIFNKAKGLVKAVLPFYLFTLLPLATACSDDFLEVQNPVGEPLEEYYFCHHNNSNQSRHRIGLCATCLNLRRRPSSPSSKLQV